jgi:uncharacterized protein YndB with AHSA1/START domain
MTTQDIIVEELFPHAPEAIWKALTTGALVARWLNMAPTGFEAATGTRFTLPTTPAGAWDGVIHCEVLDVVPNQRLSYSWQGGDVGNPQYGSRLDTVVTFTLAKVEGGTRLRVVHAGFASPQNDFAFRNLGDGWKKVVGRIGTVAAEAQ